MSQTSVTTDQPKAWIDESNVIVFRRGVDPGELKELYEMLGQAFAAGLKSGYEQGWKAASE